jgi:molybdopterin synthase catalytic subunit
MTFRISSTAIKYPDLTSRLTDASAGGVVTFEGRVRKSNLGREVLRLEYEAYPELAEKEGMTILEEAKEKWGVAEIVAVHRTGILEIGEPAVWIGVASAHRAEAFEACRYVIDELKERVPIWKKEHYADGDSGWIQSGG